MKNIFLLDADETLFDFSRSERESLFRALNTEREDILTRFHEINDSLWKKLERGEIEKPRLLVTRFELLSEEFSLGLDVNKTSETYLNFMAESGIYVDGAEEFLKKLQARGDCYLVTNGSARIQRGRIAKTGISRFLKGIFISEEIGAYKPSKAYTDYVAAHIPNFAAERAVWLGDSLTSDMLSAKNAGVDFILFAPKGVPEGYCGTIARSFEEAFSLISRR